MPKHNRLRGWELPASQLQQELVAAFGPTPEAWCPPRQIPRNNPVLVGRVLRIRGDEVWVDVGSKSPGAIHLREWYDAEAGQVVPPQPGDAVSVLLLAEDEATGSIVLSRREAVRWQRWVQVVARCREGDVVRGTVTRVVRGGLLVDIGYEAFLPASQIDIRRVANPGDYVGRDVECVILRIDPARRNIIVTRRRAFVHEDPMMDRRVLAAFEPGQVRVGVVKNVAEFGAFVDLGGIDGLLHAKDIFWVRGNDPRRVISLEQRLEVVVLRVNRESVSIALGLKRKVPEPGWLTPEVVGVARAIAEESRLEWLPILADALEDAGCDPALLSQLRGPDAHARGSELIDSLLAASLH